MGILTKYSITCSTWEEAAQYCNSIGGYLAVIDDLKENEYLYNWMVKQGYDSAYFGLQDKNLKDEWTDAEGGSVSTKSQKVYKGDTYGTLPKPERKGYSFLGWYTAKKGGKKVVATSYVTVTKAQTLYAHWKKDTYTIVYNLDDGKNAKNNPVSYTVTTKKIVLESPTRSGYTFKGWYLDKKYKKKITTIIHLKRILSRHLLECNLKNGTQIKKALVSPIKIRHLFLILQQKMVLQ